MVDWVKLIISPALLAIPPLDCDKFYIFAVVSCDLLWYYRNKAFHDALSFDALQVSQHINKVSLIWNILQPRIKPQLMWNAGYPVYFLATNSILILLYIPDTFSAQAVVCCNHQGHIIPMISQISHPYLPNYDEALAARLISCFSGILDF
jgi:hypothetical protein